MLKDREIPRYYTIMYVSWISVQSSLTKVSQYDLLKKWTDYLADNSLIPQSQYVQTIFEYWELLYSRSGEHPRQMVFLPQIRRISH